MKYHLRSFKCETEKKGGEDQRARSGGIKEFTCMLGYCRGGRSCHILGGAQRDKRRQLKDVWRRTHLERGVVPARGNPTVK